MQSMNMFSCCVVPTPTAAFLVEQLRHLRPMALAWHSPPASPNQGIAGSTPPKDENDTNERRQLLDVDDPMSLLNFQSLWQTPF